MIKLLKKIISVVLALIVSATLLTACSQKKEELVDISTSLKFNQSFSGTRTIIVKFPKSIVSIGSPKETSLDKVVQKYCPDSIKYSKDIADGMIVYTFSLNFTSAHDYSEKIEKIIEKPVNVAFSNPNTVLTHGWKLQEDFSSVQLLSWIAEGAEKENFEDLSFKSVEKTTKASLNDDEVSTDEIISVNNLSGYPIQKIRIDTVNKNTVFDRTVTFTISQTTFDELRDKLTDYFMNVTASSAKFDWPLENGSYLYKVKFEDISLQELEGYTNKLLNSVYCDASYTDTSAGSTPLAEQNSFTETLDFSSYISNSKTNVPIEYTYSVENSEELGECQLYQNGEWIPATNLMDSNKYGKLSAIKSSDSFIKLRINDGKQYICSSVDISCTPLDDDKIEKDITFSYDIATGGNEAVNYALSYFKRMDIPAEHAVEGGKNTCTVKFIGTSEEVSKSFADIFGSENKTAFKEYMPMMTLRTIKQFNDNIDLSKIITGKNNDTPINYSIKTNSGDILKKFSAEYESSGDDSKKTINADISNGQDSIRLESAHADISFDVSSLNFPDIIAMCILSAVIITGGIFAVFIIRKRKPYIVVQAEDIPQKLPENTHRKKNDT